MLGKASEIKTKSYSADFVEALSDAINVFLKEGNYEIIDIQYRMTQPHKNNLLFHTALIIYKEETA